MPGWRGRDAPEVDVAVIASRRYERGPVAADVAAFIEAFDTTYADDRGYKMPLYVSAGIPAWLVNIATRRVEIYADSADL